MPQTMLVRFILPAVLWLLSGMLTTAARADLAADLAIMGGDPAQQQSAWNVFDQLPPCCRPTRPVCVHILNDEAMNTYLRECEGSRAANIRNDAVDGLYQNASPTITLRATSSAADVTATFAHEYGHYVWLNVLTRDQRDQYVKVYDVQRAAGHLVSSYAAVSVEEGFAEAFSFYVLRHPILAQKDPCSDCCLKDFLSGNCQKIP